MTFKAALIAAAVAAAAIAGPAVSAPLSAPQAAPGFAGSAPVSHVGGSDRRYARRDCTPINGPYGYYGNPWCEGGYSRYGEAGGYEIDLIPYLDGRAYRNWDRRPVRRYRY